VIPGRKLFTASPLVTWNLLESWDREGGTDLPLHRTHRSEHSSQQVNGIMSASLTKKQQKALAFRAKQKAKKSGRADGEQEDVPELDLEVDEVVDAVVIAQASKKKRRHDTKELNESEKMTGESKSTTTREKVKSRLKIAWDDDQEDEGDGGKKSKKEIKQRFILFVGR